MLEPRGFAACSGGKILTFPLFVYRNDFARGKRFFLRFPPMITVYRIAVSFVKDSRKNPRRICFLYCLFALSEKQRIQRKTTKNYRSFLYAAGSLVPRIKTAGRNAFPPAEYSKYRISRAAARRLSAPVLYGAASPLAGERGNPRPVFSRRCARFCDTYDKIRHLI